MVWMKHPDFSVKSLNNYSMDCISCTSTDVQMFRVMFNNFSDSLTHILVPSSDLKYYFAKFPSGPSVLISKCWVKSTAPLQVACSKRSTSMLNSDGLFFFLKMQVSALVKCLSERIYMWPLFLFVNPVFLCCVISSLWIFSLSLPHTATLQNVVVFVNGTNNGLKNDSELTS